VDSREEDGLMKASRSPATKRDVGRGRQTEPTYCCPTAAEKRKRRVATGEPGWRGEESKRPVDLDEGEARVGMQRQRQGHDQTHHPIIIGAKMWESKRRIGSWRRPAWMDGDGGRAGQNKRDVQGKQAKELKSRQRWRLLQMNQATSVSL
jgi:hypothetical protein